jgi:multicomponent Na+:H+ antiporter subunit E
LVHAIFLGAGLFAVWLLLSGHFEPLIIALGILSCLGVVFVSWRMDVVDREGVPVHLSFGPLWYWPWLGMEIVKANIDVTKRILSPRLSISPTMVRLKASQKSDLGLVIYANSITLTPGTVSVDVEPGEILVHALSKEAAEDLKGGVMDRQVTKMAGET